MAFEKGHVYHPRRKSVAEMPIVNAPDVVRDIRGALTRLSEVRVGRPTNEELAEQTAMIRRWGSVDLDEWLLTRLKDRWGNTDQYWHRHLLNFQSSNDYLFITNGEAVLLAMQQRNVLAGATMVIELLAWSRDDGKALRPLYRALREWAGSLKARLYAGFCSDLDPRDILELLSRERAYYVVGLSP